MNQSNKTPPVLYSAAEMRHRDHLRERSQQRSIDNKQLRKSFSDIRDVDDFRKALVCEIEDEFQPVGKLPIQSDKAAQLSWMSGNQNEGNPEEEHQSRGRWITESEAERQTGHIMVATTERSESLQYLSQEIGSMNSDWQQFELETKTVGKLNFAFKRDERGLCLKLSAQEKTVNEILKMNWEAISKDLSKAMGLNVRLLGSAEND
ncbi:hypothetical protein [Limnobacter alexandrii]|jgi:hypothetical protein|uniref:hypothetical protein n=1 Tax=Limnobacter alexandrii TaxID=2570352 RepID=UPI00110876F2|nr:hypothetical protein [Limnobacter alexandrii]